MHSGVSGLHAQSRVVQGKVKEQGKLKNVKAYHDNI